VQCSQQPSFSQEKHEIRKKNHSMASPKTLLSYDYPLSISFTTTDSRDHKGVSVSDAMIIMIHDIKCGDTIQ